MGPRRLIYSLGAFHLIGRTRPRIILTPGSTSAVAVENDALRVMCEQARRKCSAAMREAGRCASPRAPVVFCRDRRGFLVGCAAEVGGPLSVVASKSGTPVFDRPPGVRPPEGRLRGRWTQPHRSDMGSDARSRGPRDEGARGQSGRRTWRRRTERTDFASAWGPPIAACCGRGFLHFGRRHPVRSEGSTSPVLGLGYRE